MQFLVPDYYPSFHCKINKCRSACCDGWPVTFSMKDYFKLLSVECSPELRRRLDTALHLIEYPTEDEYGMILPRFDGKCPMRYNDGRCGLQAESGEAALPAVCKLYPRAIRPGECCCSNSCEAVIELLDRDRPVSFISIEQDLDVPVKNRIHFFETGDREMEIRMWLIHFLQDHYYPLSIRLLRMGKALHQLDEALVKHDDEQIGYLLEGHIQIDAPKVYVSTSSSLQLVQGLLERLNNLSDSIRDYGNIALEHYKHDGLIGTAEAKNRIASITPYWEQWFENMLVNHMFFSEFPFQDRPVSLKNEVIALFAVYGLLQFLMVGAGDGTHDRQIDIAAALFRLVDHTAFDMYAVPILNELSGENGFIRLLGL